jgi:Ca2+-binding EF-hand superfamily protein
MLVGIIIANMNRKSMKGGDTMINATSSGMNSMNFGPMRGVQGSQGKDDLFTKVDTNQDGSLDESEVATFAEKMSEMTGQSADAAEMMAKFDTDEDGTVTESEFSAARHQGPPPPPPGGMMPPGGMQASDTTETTSSLISSLDSDGDGSVSEDEFKVGLNTMIQEYMNQSFSTGEYASSSGGLLSVEA